MITISLLKSDATTTRMAQDALMTLSNDIKVHQIHPATTLKQKDLSTWLSVASLILSLPGGITATIDLARRAKLASLIERLQHRLRTTGTSAVLSVDGEAPVELAMLSADVAVDLLLKHYKR